MLNSRMFRKDKDFHGGILDAGAISRHLKMKTEDVLIRIVL